MDVKEQDKKPVTKKKAKVKKAKHHFIKVFKTQSKEYKIGDPCYQDNENVLKFLITNKYIK
jgi:hypothetical protein